MLGQQRCKHLDGLSCTMTQTLYTNLVHPWDLDRRQVLPRPCHQLDHAPQGFQEVLSLQYHPVHLCYLECLLHQGVLDHPQGLRLPQHQDCQVPRLVPQVLHYLACQALLSAQVGLSLIQQKKICNKQARVFAKTQIINNYPWKQRGILRILSQRHCSPGWFKSRRHIPQIEQDILRLVQKS